METESKAQSTIPLEALFQEARVEREDSPRDRTGLPQIQKIRYTHDAMIDLIIANPWVSQNEIAAHFGYTAAWVSLIFSSDAFKERLTARKDELIDPTIRASIEERLKAVVSRSLEVLAEKLAKPAAAVPDALALRAAEMGAKALGLGGNAPAQNVVPLNHLEGLAQRLLLLKSQTLGGSTYEGEIKTIEG